MSWEPEKRSRKSLTTDYFHRRKRLYIAPWRRGNLWNPSEKLWMRHEPFVMSADSVRTLLSFLACRLSFSHRSSFPVWWIQNGFYLWNPSWGQHIMAGRGGDTGTWMQHLGFSGFSHSAFQSMTTAIVRGRRDLATRSGHGKNGTASTFHTSLGVTANFLYCTFDWKHIWNIFLWSHFRRTIESKREKMKKKNSEGSGNDRQTMS